MKTTFIITHDLKAGTYEAVYRLTVTDSTSATVTKDITITAART